MVKMVPPSLVGESNYGERTIFGKLKDDTGHPNWIAIHSLSQTITARKFEAEGDFVVLVPGKGIVIIEVKGATAATLEGETWTFEGVAEGAIHKDPFDQIQTTRTNIKRRLRQNDIDDFAIPMARLVWLPKLQPFQFAEIGERGLLVGQWEMAFSPDLENVPATIQKCLDEYIRSMADNPDVNFAPETFTDDLATQVERILLVDAKAHATTRELSRIQHQELQQATNNQMLLLDSIIDNQDIYLEGAAGTGKSRMLGLAAVKMASSGRRVLLTCYNQMMADFLTEEYGKHPLIDAICIHDLFFDSIPQKQGKTSQDWFDTELPRLAKRALLENGQRAVYDVICIDEFQDVATKPDVLGAIFTYFSPDSDFSPRVILAGDDSQNIYGVHDGTNSFDIAKGIYPDITRFKLLTNCRQAPALSDAVYRFLDLDNGGLRHVVPKDVESGFEVVRPKAGNETKELAKVLRELLKRYDPEHIRLLSPYKKKSLISQLFQRESEDADERWLKTQLRHQSTDGKIRWRSIGKFKGLESDVVVITDIDNKSKEWAESIGLWLQEMLYVGMTRAKFHLVLMIGDGLFESKSVQPTK